MSILPDPYKVLGISKDAQIPEIRSAHRKLVLKCHPDKVQDPALKEEKQVEFQQVQQAYELLSDEVEREKYDRKVEALESAREREKAKNAAPKPASSTPMTPKREPVYFDVKDVSPRVNTFSKSSPFGKSPTRNWEDTAPSRPFDEVPHHPRKSASYEKEKSSSKRDEERRRRKEEEERARERDLREARKSKERKEEKDRMARDREEREREKRKEEKKKAQSDREREREKERERERDKDRKGTTEKLRPRYPTFDETDPSDSDVFYEPSPSKSDRKKANSSRKMDDIEPPLTTDRARKLSGVLENAIRYLERSGGNAPPFPRPQTFTDLPKHVTNPMVTAPTPPPAVASFAPPPPVPASETAETEDDDDVMRRSSARRPRRMSHETPRSSREKTASHKKPSSSREHQPIIVEGESPRSRNIPTFVRSQTESSARPIPTPGLSRSKTWVPSTEREYERHERIRTHHAPTFSEDDESEADRERRHLRGRRTHSPEPLTPQTPTHHRPTTDAKMSIPIRQKQYSEQPLRGSYKTQSAYVTPNPGRLHRAHTSYVREYYENDEHAQHFPKVAYAQQYNEHDIYYSSMPYPRPCRSDVYAA